MDYASLSMETLFIFGLNADYINAFLESIKTEEVEFDEEEISIRFNQPSKWVARIHTIGTREDFNFADNLVELKVDDKLISELEVDLRPKIVLAHGMETSHADLDSSSLLSLDQSQLNLLDWNLMHCNLLDYKVAQGYYNLLISKASLKEIITSGRYRILTSPEQRDLSSFSEVSRLESIVMSYLKSYIDRFYRRSEKREAMNNLTVKKLNRQNDNLNFEKFVLKFPRGSVVVGEIQKLLKALKKVYSLDDPIIPSVHFDRHLYTPLLVYLKGREEIKSYPVKLNKGETKFIKDLRDYLVKNPNELGKNEVFVLRNLSKRGIGFFQSSGFYPDFILWVKSR